MQRAHNQAARRQATNTASVPDVDNFSGGVTASTGDDVGTSLLVGATVTSSPSVTNALVPGQDTITLTTSPTSTQTGATSSTSSPSSSSSSSSLSTGAVVGLTVGAFVVVIGAMFAIYSTFKRRAASRARRATARGPPPVVRRAAGASGSGKEKQWSPKGGVNHGDSKERPISGATNITTGKIALFEKDLSVRSVSDEKVNVSISDNHTFDPSAMPDFTKYNTALADDLSNLPPSRPFIARGEGSTVVSWDSDAASADPLLSLRASAAASGTMSPSSVTVRQTPRTIDSAQHRWESAEVLIMDEPTTAHPSVYSEATQDPFHDNSAPRPSNGGSDSDSRVGGSNPFFNAAQHNPFSDRSARSRKSSVSTAKRSRSNSVSSGGTLRAGASEGALLSLIAALDNPPLPTDEHTIRTSLQTVTTSIYSPTEPGVPMPAPKAF